jgi:hypothetical protein
MSKSHRADDERYPEVGVLPVVTVVESEVVGNSLFTEFEI